MGMLCGGAWPTLASVGAAAPRARRLLLQLLAQHLPPEETSELRAAFDAHSSRRLKWQEELQELGGTEGRVIQDDPEDGTSQVRFAVGSAAQRTYWIPTDKLVDIEDSPQGQDSMG